ncbi:hypothetical protein F5B21DRAFT_526883 [Xylaria acuta]|nr:hypothetical protein F5B21DRAFT_526883 [Xylaria acuta]
MAPITVAQKSKKPVKTTHAGVKKAKKHNTNKRQTNSHDHGGHTLATATSQPADLPNEDNMLVFSEINFSPVIIKAMLALAMMATPGNNEIAGSSSNPLNPTTFFDSLPTELLIQISEALPVEDRIRTALTYPQLFMNDNRLNLFTRDAYYQLDIRTYRTCNVPPAAWLDRVRQLRQPLLFDAILPQSGSFTVDEIELILKQYEKVCIDNSIDPNTFLNCVFPDLRPANVPPPSNGPHSLDLMSPLHVAVEAGRDDIVQYFIQRGADVNRTAWYWRANRSVTPFEFGVEFRASLMFNTLVDRARTRMIEEIILMLAYTSPITAYTVEFQTSREMDLALLTGNDRLALLLLQRFENLDNIDRTSDRYQVVRNRVLELALTRPLPMPQTIRFMLDHGGNFRFINRPVMRSVTLESALRGGNEENSIAALQWEIQTQAGELIQLTIGTLARLATRDANYIMLRPLANEFIRHNHYRGQSELLSYSIVAGENSSQIRGSLLHSVRDDALDGVPLRVAIRYRDRNAVAFILKSMLRRGQSIDEPLPMEQGVTNIGHWFNTPLTYALSQENYFEAATLLSLGANPNQVPPNIRHRVRVIRDRINAGYIVDTPFFIFRGLNLNAYLGPIAQEAQWALDHVFSRLLDDPRYPMPNYVRTRRHGNLPSDHPDNDSEREDPPEDDPLLTGVAP